MKPDHGGPVHPNPSGMMETGISVRDWYAGLAMQALVAHESPFLQTRVTAERAFDLADAMIAERKIRQCL